MNNKAFTPPTPSLEVIGSWNFFYVHETIEQLASIGRTYVHITKSDKTS